jgi:hypothetical protein
VTGTSENEQDEDCECPRPESKSPDKSRPTTLKKATTPPAYRV